MGNTEKPMREATSDQYEGISSWPNFDYNIHYTHHSFDYGRYIHSLSQESQMGNKCKMLYE